MTNAEKTAIQKIKSHSTETLCAVFEESNNNHDNAVPMVRGWIMDELEERDPDAFDRWMDCEDVELLDKPSLFFI